MRVYLVGYGKINQLVHQKIKHSIVGIYDLNNNYLSDEPDLIIDFSNPKALDTTIQLALKYKAKVLIGTTGYTYRQYEKIKKLSKSVAVLMASNFSVGMILLSKFFKDNSKYLNNFDKHIIEIHNKNKVDCPSGTAKVLADLLNCKNITSIRSKDVIGTHEVILISDDEVINIKHTITSRNNFINGVLKAVEYLKGKEVGLYDMEDIIDAM